jgi:hypothetical protein
VFVAIVIPFGLRRNTSRRVWHATDEDISGLETHRVQPARIVLGDPMPEMVKLLPEPGELAA